MRVDLTVAEARAVLRGLGETLDATDDGEKRTIFGSLRDANAAARADRKLRDALRAERRA